jgi:alpha-1,6-mannosyltransferase
MTVRARARGETPVGVPARIRARGRAGVLAAGTSILLTIVVSALGPSVMEPALPGRPGQPPWSLAGHPSGYLAVALTAAALLLGAAGLGLAMHAARHGWRMPPGLLLAAGLGAAVLLTLLPPFGSSDHLSYAAYGRMLTTGHNPYLTTPGALARLGDPVARAVEDWKNSPSVYGALATGGQALASLIGGTSVRLTVFVMSLLNLAGFAGAGLLLHRLAAGDRGRQLRAALLWTANPLLLQVLVAGAHVDSQAILFAVAAVAAFAVALRRAATAPAGWPAVRPAAAAGALAGLGFAVKLSFALVAAGLAVACWLARPGAADAPGPGTGRAPWYRSATAALAGGLVTGFAVVAAAALAIGGTVSIRSALSAGSYVAIGTPWRWVRAAVSLATGESVADNLVKAVAALAVLALAWLLLRRLPGPARLAPVPAAATGRPGWPGLAAGDAAGDATGLAARAVLAFALAWLTAGPYVLPWYDAFAWALLPLLPWSALDWLVLARTTALAIGYLPARTVTMPAGTGWLVSVMRRGVTPALLLAVAVALLATLRKQQVTKRAVPAGAGK